MQYLLLLSFPPGRGPQEGTPAYDDEMRRWGELNDELRSSGAMVGASGLVGQRGRAGGARRTPRPALRPAAA